MLLRFMTFLANALTCGIRTFGCLMTSLSVGLILFAVFGMNTPAARDGRGMVIFLGMIAALFGLPFLLGGWSGGSGSTPPE